jgi:hypothetical protein
MSPLPTLSFRRLWQSEIPSPDAEPPLIAAAVGYGKPAKEQLIEWGHASTANRAAGQAQPTIFKPQ